MSGRSDRRSGRVDMDRSITAGQPADQPPSAPESRSVGGNHEPPAPEGGRRLSRDRLHRLAAVLTDRDNAVLSSIDNYGLLTTKQIERLHFSTYSSPEVCARVCRRDLNRLRTDRLIEPLHRRIGGLRAGSASYVWRLGPAGDQLRRLADPDLARMRRKEPSWRFLDHRLAVAEVACRLTDAARTSPLELLMVEPEPNSWRFYSGSYGGREVLKPDLFAVTADGEYEDHWFIEVDRGTESLPTVLGQCEQYERYRRTGSEQAAAGLFPRVLWLVPDQHRAAQLAEGITKRPTLDGDLFRVVPNGDLLAAVTTNQKGGEHA